MNGQNSLDFLKSSESIVLHLHPVPAGHTRVFVQVRDFTPFFFDAQDPLEKPKVLYQANQEFARCLESFAPLNLKFTRFLRFTDGVLLTAELATAMYEKEKPLVRPAIAEPYGLEQEWAGAVEIDKQDFSLYFAKKFPASLYPNQLLAHMTNPSYFDEGSTQNMIVWTVFLFYCKAWFSTAALLDKLFERFNLRPPLKFASPDFLTYYFVQHMVPVRVLVLKLVVCWLQFYRDDFAPEDLAKLRAFLDQHRDSYYQPQVAAILELVEKPPPKLLAEKFSTILNKTNSGKKDGYQFAPQFHPGRVQFPMFSLYLGKAAAPKSILLANVHHEFLDEFSVTPSERQLQYVAVKRLHEAKADQLACAIHYYLYETYRNMHPREFIGAPHSKPATQHQCPNVTLHIRRTNVINHYVATQILGDKKSGMNNTYWKFVDVARRLREMRNFDAAMAVVNGFCWAPVERLKLFSESGTREQQQKCTELRTLFGLGDNWQTIRREMAALPSDTMCVPVLSIVLKDVFMTEDNQPRLEEGRCNMTRAFFVWRAVHQYIRFQAAPFKNIQFNAEMYIELCQKEEQDEDKVWEMSFAAQQKE